MYNKNKLIMTIICVVFVLCFTIIGLAKAFAPLDITIVSTDGSQVQNNINSIEDLTIPEREGYNFCGWYDNETCDGDAVTEIASNLSGKLTLYPKWQINQYTITFHSNGGSLIDTITQDYNTAVAEPVEPTKIGYIFNGWYCDSELETAYTFDTMPAEDITLFASWTIDQFAITFDSNGGNAVNPITQDYNSAVVGPQEPIKTGYIFNGWYSDSELNTLYVFDTMPEENITLYAKWAIDQFTITFDSNGGSAVNEITQDYNSALVEPQPPTKEHNTFIYWCSDGGLTTEYTFTTMPAEDITLYAKWSVNQYTISFESNGGNAVDPITQDYNSAVIEPVEPTKTNYIFDGWYSDSELETAYTFETMPAEDITLYGKWLDVFECVFDVTENVDACSISLKDSNIETNILIPSHYNSKPITEIEQNGFSNTNIISVNIPKEVMTIKEEAFKDCSSLVNLTFEENSILNTIEDYAFYNTAIDTLNIPDSITSIGQYAFSKTRITNLFIPDVTYGSYAFAENNLLTQVTFANTIVNISTGILYTCSALSSASLPSNLEVIGDQAFCQCFELESIILPDSLTVIGISAFSACNSITEIVIPHNVTYIGMDAFRGISPNFRTSLECVTIERSINDGAITTGNIGMFDNCSENLIIYVPRDSIDDYKGASNWSNYADIISGMEFTVNYNTNGGTVAPIQEQVNDFSTLATPTRDGYLFDGWYFDDGTFVEPFDFTDVTDSQPIDVYAKWIAE